MLVLGIETSTPQASVTIGSEQGIIGSCTISRGAAYGEFLLPAVEFLMHQSGLTYRQLSAVAIGLGPGLFTGMRVGVTLYHVSNARLYDRNPGINALAFVQTF